MVKPSKRTAVYLDPDLHRVLKFKSLETSRSVSELVNDAVRHELMDDEQDLKIFKARSKEPTVPYEQLLRQKRTLK